MSILHNQIYKDHSESFWEKVQLAFFLPIYFFLGKKLFRKENPYFFHLPFKIVQFCAFYLMFGWDLSMFWKKFFHTPYVAEVDLEVAMKIYHSLL